MGYRVAIGTRTEEVVRDVDVHDDLDDAMETLNKLINQKNYSEPDSVVSLFDTRAARRWPNMPYKTSIMRKAILLDRQ